MAWFSQGDGGEFEGSVTTQTTDTTAVIIIIHVGTGFPTHIFVTVRGFTRA